MDNVEKAVSYIENSVGAESAITVIRLAIVDLKKGIDSLNRAFLAEDCASASKAAHALAGSLATFALTEAADVCRTAISGGLSRDTTLECTRRTAAIIEELELIYARKLQKVV